MGSKRYNKKEFYNKAKNNIHLTVLGEFTTRISYKEFEKIEKILYREVRV